MILPVWHQLTLRDIAEVAPLLAGRLGTDTSHGIEHVIDDLIRAHDHGPSEASVDVLAHSEIPELAEVFEQEPLDLYAEAQEQMELGSEAGNRIVEGMDQFTERMNRFTAENHALAEARTRMGPRVLRARINLIVPIFDRCSGVIERNAPTMGESMGKALLSMTRGLVLDGGGTTARRNSWVSTLQAVVEKAEQSKTVMEQGLEALHALGALTGLMKRAKRRLAGRIQEYIEAHQRVIDDVREAIRLLSDE